MPKNWGTNSKVEEAREREKQKKKAEKTLEEEKKEAAKWEDNDKAAQIKLERKKEAERKKQEELDRKQENKKLYEEEMKSIVSNKQQKNPPKLTKAEIKRREEEALIKSLKKNIEEKKKDTNSNSSSDNEFKPKLEPNINHILREQQEIDNEKYEQVIDARGLDDAINQLDINKQDLHPEKRMKAAWEKYLEDNIPKLKIEYPSLKRSQLVEILKKDWKNAPENPFNK